MTLVEVHPDFLLSLRASDTVHTRLSYRVLIIERRCGSLPGKGPVAFHYRLQAPPQKTDLCGYAVLPWPHGSAEPRPRGYTPNG